MRSRSAIAALLVALGCGEGPGAIDGGPRVELADAARDAPAAAADAAIDAGGGCAPIAVSAPAWLDAYERELLAALTGASEIAPGVTIHERGTVASRDHARRYLAAELEALGLAVELHAYGSGANVIATLPATIDPGASLVVLGGHFDGVTAGPAAADNGTGTVLVVAAARWIVESMPCRTRDLAFVLFDEEERGLVGSGEYADRLLAEDAPVHAVYSFDMLSHDGDGDRTIEMWLPTDTIFATWTAAAAAHGARVTTQRFSSSDHQSFYARRIPTSGFCEEFVGGDTSPYYHTPDDTFDKVDFAYLGLATTVAVEAVARDLALR